MRPERSSVEYEEVEDAGADTEDCSPGERHVGSPGGAALPEHAEEEDGSHRRGDESQNRLEYIEEVEALDAVDGNADKHRKYGSDDGDLLSDADELFGTRLRMALHVDVHGKHRGKGIKGRADGRDKGSSEHGEHQSDHSHGEKIGDHGHISHQEGYKVPRRGSSANR